MEIKSIDELSITECCERLGIDRNNLPETFEPKSSTEQLILGRLTELLHSDKEAYEACHSLEDYQRYRDIWTDGLYKNSAYQKINEISAAKEQALLEEETQFFNRNKDTKDGCKAYMAKYPNGRYVSEAKEMLKRYTKRLVCIWAFILLVVAGVILFAVFLSESAQEPEPVLYSPVETATEMANEVTESATETKIEEEAIEYPVMEYTPTPYLRVSSDYLSFDSDGGTRNISIEANNSWYISTGTASWGTTSTSDNTITLQVNPNSGDARSDYFIVKSGSLQKRIEIYQSSGNPTNFKAAKSVVRFETSEDYEYVNISNNSNKNLSVSESASWITTYVISNTQIKISCSKNNNSPRSGTVYVKCGSKEVSISVKQAGWILCSACNGYGNQRCTNWNASYNIYGWHVVQNLVYWFDPMCGCTHSDFQWTNCPQCGGTGQIRCSRCGGSGRVKSSN